MQSITNFARAHSLSFARFALFVVFFWFGILKVVAESPANPLVSELLGKTMPFMSFDLFILLLGIFEVVIGISFLFPKFLKFSITFLAIHILTTLMPLILLPAVTWTSMFVPTLEGQYIIKNILIIALAMILVANTNLSNQYERS